MKEQYVIKTRNDIQEYLCWDTDITENFSLTDDLNKADKYSSVEEARKYLGVNCLVNSRYKYDIYKVVQALEFVERGV